MSKIMNRKPLKCKQLTNELIRLKLLNNKKRNRIHQTTIYRNGKPVYVAVGSENKNIFGN